MTHQKPIPGLTLTLILSLTCTITWAQPVPKMKALPVEVRKVSLRRQEPAIFLVGTAYPEEAASVSAQVAGQIQHFVVSEGTFVDEGEVICQLDDTRYRLQVELLRARLAQAQAELAKLQAGFREEEIKQRKAQVDSWQALAEKQRLNQERIANLYAKKMASQEEKENAYWDYQQTKAKLAEAQALLHLAEAGFRAEEIEAAKAAVASAQAELQIAEEDLAKTTIVAPFRGVVTKKYRQLGEWVAAGEPLVELIAIDRILVETFVPEKEISRIRHGQRAEVAFDALPGKTFNGIVKEIIPQASLDSRSFPVKIEIDNPKHQIYAGEFARIRLIVGEAYDALFVPKDALIQDKDQSVVFVVRNGVARRVVVETGAGSEDWIEVRGELKPGEQVVVTNNEALRDGMPVVIGQPRPDSFGK